MKFLGYDKVLCLSPHPDDVEYSMLGTIIKCHDTFFTVLCLTGGGTKCLKGSCTNSGKDVDRRQEVLNCWADAGISNVEVIFSDCQYLEDKDRDPGWISYLEENYIKESNYDCLMIPPQHDSQFEHRFVNQLGAGLLRHHAISIVEYQTPSTLNSWNANTFVIIDSEYNKKTKCLMNFKSQLKKSYFLEQAFDSFHINFQCVKKRLNKVEQYRIVEFFMKDKK